MWKTEKLNSNKEFDTLELAVLYKKLPIDLKSQILSPYVSIDKNQARITMRIIDTHKNLRRDEFINKLDVSMKNLKNVSENMLVLTVY